MALGILQLFTLYRYTPGRRAWMLGRIAEAADKLGLSELAAAALARIDAEKALAGDLRKWTTVRAGADSAEVNQGLIAGDQARDALLGAFASFLEALALRASSAAGQAAARLSKEAFPDGPRKIITLPYPDETAAIEALVVALRGEHAADVKAAGAGEWVDDIAAANADFTSLYNRLSAARELDFKTLRTRDEANQVTFLRLVAKIVATSDDPAQLGKLLDPIDVQQAAMKALYQSRKTVTDVDAETGDPLPDAVATGATAPTG